MAALFIDGDARLKVSRQFRAVLATIARDLGGADRLSEGQKQIARRCAMLSVECEIMESVAGGRSGQISAQVRRSRDHGRLSLSAGFGRSRRRVVPGSDARAVSGGA